jgi:hypothetical protein
MKTISGYFTLIFACSFFNSFSQEQVIKLKMKEGHEYVFEKVDKDYYIKEDNSKEFTALKTKEIRLIVEEVKPDGIILLTLEHLKNIHDGRSSREVLNRTDHFYPNFAEGENQYADSRNFIEPLLCRSKLKFSINSETNEIILLNRVELLEQFHTRLIEQEYSPEIISGYIKEINSRKFFD